MKGITPVQCPEITSDMLNFLRSDGSSGAASVMAYLTEDTTDNVRLEHFGPNEEDKRAAQIAALRMGNSVEIADQYIIAKHMTKEVLEAAGELSLDMDVQRHWFDTDDGVLFFEQAFATRAFATETAKHYEAQVYAITWSIKGGVIRITNWVDTAKFLHLAGTDIADDYDRPRINKQDVAKMIAAVGPLIICGSYVVPINGYMQSLARDDYARSALRVLLSAMLMLRQEITARSVVTAPKSRWAPIARVSPLLGRTVTVIDKRAVRRNPTNEAEVEVGTRQLSVRYDRRGHWREYKHERFSPEMREHPIWIPAHWVGHEGLPLATRSKVTRLTR